jgi:hypothetical protein
MMAATGEWKVSIEAPNGATAEFVFDTGKSTDPFGEMTRQFSDLICRMPEHDPEPLTSDAQHPGLFQQRQQVVAR